MDYRVLIWEAADEMVWEEDLAAVLTAEAANGWHLCAVYERTLPPAQVGGMGGPGAARRVTVLVLQRAG